MKTAILQFTPEFGQPEANLEAIANLGKGLSADLVVLPELCTTGYQFLDPGEVDRLAEPLDGPSVGRLAELAKSWGGHVVAGFAEAAPGGPFNSAALIGPDGPVDTYRKVHLFGEENRFFTPGDRGFPVWTIDSVTLGIMICFDWVYPESTRSLALAGAQIVAHPANLVLPFCQAAMVTRAVENRIFTLTANRTGSEERRPGERLAFTGRSQIVEPEGQVLADGPPDRPKVIQIEIDPTRAKDKRITDRNDLLADRRPDQYRS